MNLIKRIIGHQAKSAIIIPSKGNCPNCWGIQEYGSLKQEKYRDIQIEVNNRRAKYAFIQQFVVRFISGIKLKDAYIRR